ncbi:MAG: hypothetical protein FIA92_06560 [Chloroflexi bacterium]|nr:hypothetical protein [Chloroflexota bacterium]
MKTPPAARDLAIGVAAVIALSRFAPDPFAWPLAGFLVAATVVGVLQLLADTSSSAESAGVPIESVVLPGLAAGAGALAIRLVPLGFGLALGVVLLGALLLLAIATEARLVRSSSAPSSADRTAVGIQLLVVGFLAFAGVADVLPGVTVAAGGATPPPDPIVLVAFAGLDALIGMALGYRAAALRSTSLRDVGTIAIGAGMVMAIAALALHSIELPRLIGPALLVLVFFLWDAIHGGRPTRRRDSRRLWETAFLVVIAVAVVAWSFGMRP